jgi:hypothetical protein
MSTCQQSRRARRAIDLRACVPYACNVLGACVVRTSVLHRTETERGRGALSFLGQRLQMGPALGRLRMLGVGVAWQIYTPLIMIPFSASAQVSYSDLFPYHNRGGAEEAA